MHSVISIEPHASIAVGWTPKTFLWLKVMQVVWVTCVTAAALRRVLLTLMCSKPELPAHEQGQTGDTAPGTWQCPATWASLSVQSATGTASKYGRLQS